jgi:hypothetical protein
MPKRDDLINQIFEGEGSEASRSAEARMWQSVKADLKAMKDHAPECQVTFDHLEGRLYAETVRTQPRSFWIPAAAAGCLVLGAAYVFGLQMGRQNSVVPTVAMATPGADRSAPAAGLRTESFDELTPAPLTAPAQAELAAPAPVVGAPKPAAPLASAPVRSADRPKPAPRRAVKAPQAVAAAAPAVSESPAATLAANPEKASDALGDGTAGPVLAAGAAMAALSRSAEEADAAPAVVVVPSIPRGRSGAPVAIENPVMGDLVFGG